MRRVGALVEYVEIAGVDHAYDIDDVDRAAEMYPKIAGYIAAATSSKRTTPTKPTGAKSTQANKKTGGS